MALENKNEDIGASDYGVVVKTMPDQFYATQSAKKIPILLILLIIIILGGVTLAGVYFYRENSGAGPLVQVPASTPVKIPEANPSILSSPIETTPPAPPAGLPESSPTTPPATLPPPVIAPPAPITQTPVELTSTQDTDSDKLTDVEEELFGTDPKLPDTDSDGHLDGGELINLFDPSRSSPAALDQSSLIKTQRNDLWQYDIYYPAKWVSRPIDSDQREIMFSSPLGEFIEVLVLDNLEKFPLAEWYQRQSPGVSTVSLESFVTKRSIKVLRSLDGLTYYLTPDGPDIGTAIFALSYNAGTANVYNFLSTFQVMINSFKVSQIINRPAPVPSAVVPPPSTDPSGPTAPPSSEGPN